MLGYVNLPPYLYYVLKEIHTMNAELNDLIALYVNNSITDVELWDRLDTLTGESSTLVEESHDYDWDVDNTVEYDYELEASRYDYL